LDPRQTNQLGGKKKELEKISLIETAKEGKKKNGKRYRQNWILLMQKLKCRSLEKGKE